MRTSDEREGRGCGAIGGVPGSVEPCKRGLLVEKSVTLDTRSILYVHNSSHPYRKHTHERGCRRGTWDCASKRELCLSIDR